MDAFIKKFIEHMSGNGIEPVEAIIGDGRSRRAKIKGDKANKKSLWYCLNIEDDHAWGAYQNHKETEIIRFSARRAGKKETPEEKAKRTAAIQAKRDEYGRELQAKQDKAAEKAKRIWEAAEKLKGHPYVTNKGINPYTARHYNNALVVPIYDDREIVNLQFIDADGNKRFLSGAKKKGCSGRIGSSSDDTSRIAICEGYATGCSLREALGIPVVIAFDAGNLLPVAENIRKKFPDSELIFCSDNDQWRDGGNIGVLKAQSALDEVGGQGRVVTPKFSPTHPDRPTDWNDKHRIDGLQAIIDEIPLNTAVVPVDDYAGYEPDYEYNAVGDNKPASHSVAVRYDGNWESMMIWKSEAKGILHKAYRNIANTLKYRPGYRDLFFYNEFASDEYIINVPDWEEYPSKFKPHPVEDVDVLKLRSQLEFAGYPSVTEGDCWNAVREAARMNSFHPAREYFSTLKWDGVERLDNLLPYYCGCETEDVDYLRAVGSKTIIAAVARIMEPGCKFDHMLVLEGPQGAGKSRFIRLLATFGDTSYSTDSVSIDNIDDKDTIAKLQGRVFIEFAELSGLNKKEMEAVKRWLTLQADEGRPPYGRKNKIYKRQFVDIGTNNPFLGWLDDPTGGRRFWPVTVGNKIDLESLERDREQIWAEAVVRYHKGEKLYLEGRISKLAEDALDTRKAEDVWHNDVVDELEAIGGGVITTAKLLAHIGVEKQKQSRQDQNRIGKIMRSLGYEQKYGKSNGKTTRVWIKEE